MENKKLKEHGESERAALDQKEREKEISELLARYLELIPEADANKILKSMSLLQETVVYKECLSSEDEESSDSYIYDFERWGSTLIQ